MSFWDRFMQGGDRAGEAFAQGSAFGWAASGGETYVDGYKVGGGSYYTPSQGWVVPESPAVPVPTFQKGSIAAAVPQFSPETWMLPQVGVGGGFGGGGASGNNKILLLGLGAVLLAGGGYYVWRKKRGGGKRRPAGAQ